MSKPVQVYILLGQSNMLGAGKVKGEAMAETWADEDEYMEGAKMMEPL